MSYVLVRYGLCIFEGEREQCASQGRQGDIILKAKSWEATKHLSCVHYPNNQQKQNILRRDLALRLGEMVSVSKQQQDLL